MLVLVTYDINITSALGQKRLRRVAKRCESCGIRVQCSVFECVVDETQFEKLKHDLLKIIDIKSDSLRFYNLGERYSTKVEHYGIKSTIQVEDTLIL
jgi:CRISPR-associated protein Cas2